MINPLEDSIILINDFEKAITNSKLPANKIYTTKIPVNELNNFNNSDDFTEFFIKMIENSKRYTSDYVSKRDFSLETIDNQVFLVLNVEFWSGSRGFGKFNIPFRATIEDYIGITDK